MKIFLVLALLLIAGPALAQSAWSPLVIAQNKGANISTYTPDTDVASPTLQTSTCESITIACLGGTTLTGTLQLCTSSSASSCQDYLAEPLKCGGTYGETDVKASWIRLGVITNSDSAQLFQVTCK